MTSLNATAPAFAPATSQFQALLASGPQHINITAEREVDNASPDRLAFLKGVVFNPQDTATWYERVLPYLATCTFVVASTTDVTYTGTMLTSPALPDLRNAVTRLYFPEFHWFSGIGSNRLHNPCLQLARTLANLHELTLTLHPASLTTARWAEHVMIEKELTDDEAAKERILLPLGEVVRFFEIDALFACGGLVHLHLEYIESPMIAFFCKSGNPVDLFYVVKAYLEQGFARNQMQVAVTAQIVVRASQIEEGDN